jgi:membrane fusion protein
MFNRSYTTNRMQGFDHYYFQLCHQKNIQDMSSLFRKEVIDSHRQQLLGDAVLSQPLSFSVFALLLVLIVAAAITFISFGSYARKETVQGFLSPDKGIVRVHAPRIGVVGQLHVTEGRFVNAGDPLLTLLGETVTGGGLNADMEQLNVLQSQLREIEIRTALEKQRREANEKQLAAEIEGLISERSTVDQQVRVQRQLLASLQKNYDRISSVVDSGYISAAEYMSREENLINNKQVLANLLQKQTAVASRVVQQQLALQRVPLESDERLSQLASNQSSLKLRVIDFSSRKSITITAPVAGRVAALQAISGSSVDNRLPLLTILPLGGRLEAHLFVPTSAVGFVEVGQEVRLLYGAFNYRRFGTHSGVVSKISSAMFSPVDAEANIRVDEPTYRVTVQISEESVQAYGQHFPLQAGMLLTADIVLERRSLIEWLLDPLTSLRGRI